MRRMDLRLFLLDGIGVAFEDRDGVVLGFWGIFTSFLLLIY